MPKTEARAQILDKSKELFERFGYNKTTLSDIAKSVGKVKTAIYYYFSGKDEIFAQLVKEEADTFLNQLISTTNKFNESKEKLEKYVETRMLLMQKLSTRYHFLKPEFFELMPIVEENRKDADELEVKFVADIMLDIYSKNEYAIQEPKFAAKMLVKTLKGLEIQMYVTDKIKIEKSNVEEFRNFILYGFVNNNLI